MKLRFEIYVQGEPAAGYVDRIHSVTVELHEVDEDDAWREAANDCLKPALAELFETSEVNVHTEEEIKRIEEALVARGEREAEGE